MGPFLSIVVPLRRVYVRNCAQLQLLDGQHATDAYILHVHPDMSQAGLQPALGFCRCGQGG